MSDKQKRVPCRYVSFGMALLLLSLTLSSPAQTRNQAAKKFKVAYTLKNNQNKSADETYEGYLSVLPNGFQFQGSHYEQDEGGGPTYTEKFSCPEMKNLQFRPSYSAIDVEVRTQPRFIYCPRGFTELKAAITHLCREQGKGEKK